MKMEITEAEMREIVHNPAFHRKIGLNNNPMITVGFLYYEVNKK